MVVHCDDQYEALAADNTVNDVDTEDFCLSCWFRCSPIAAVDQNRYVLMKFGTLRGYIFVVSKLGGMGFSMPRFWAIDVDTDEWYRVWGITKEVDDNVWHHFATNVDRDKPLSSQDDRLYIDGIDVGGIEPGDPPPVVMPATLANDGTFGVGNDLVYTPYNGKVCDIKFLKGGLWTAEQILYQAEHPWDYSASAGSITQYWRLDEGENTTLFGSAGDDLTLSSPLAWSKDRPHYYMDRLRLILHSVLMHTREELTDIGYLDTDEWVNRGYIQPGTTSPPAVAVSHVSSLWPGFETGSAKREGQIRVRIDIYGKTDGQLENLMSQIANGLDGMRIIDFNIAMPGDDGYDQAAQTIARSHISGITSNLLDSLENTGRVSFLLRSDRPITI